MHHPDNQHRTEEAWQLIHDDPFDKAVTDEQIANVVASFAARSRTPYTEVLRRLVGIDEMTEKGASAFFERVLIHRSELSTTLRRAVHLRVAALDVLTMRPTNERTRRDSHPIIVTPSLLERAFEEATADGVTGLPQRASS